MRFCNGGFILNRDIANFSKATIVGLILTMSTTLAAQSTSPVRSFLELRQRNVVMQEWDLSCGAAALATLLNFQHGMGLTEKEVAIELINRPEYIENPELLKIKEGFSLLDLKLFVDRRGLRGEGFGGLTLDDLVEMSPVLIPVSFEGYNHFVIFRALAGNRVLVADPAWGNRTLMVDQFIDAWMDFGDIGRVGFVVSAEVKSSGKKPNNRLLATELDFVMLK